MKMIRITNYRKGSHSGARNSIPSSSYSAVRSGVGLEQAKELASGEAGHPAAIGKSLRQAPYTHTHTHTHTRRARV